VRFQRGPGPGGRPLGLRVRVGSVGDHQRGGVVGTGGCREASGDIVGGQSDCLLCTDTCRGHEEGRPGGSATDIIHTHTTAVVVGMLGGQWRDQCTVKKGGGVGTHKGGGGGGGGSEEWGEARGESCWGRRVTGGTEGRPGESTRKEKEGGRHRSNAGGGDIPQIRP
jgi:hypothetical protein